MIHDLQQATELAPGVTLLTKNGGRIGNAIVIRGIPREEVLTQSMLSYLDETNQQMWLIETDFGNRTRFCTNELLAHFELGYQQEFKDWFADRRALQNKTWTEPLI